MFILPTMAPTVWPARRAGAGVRAMIIGNAGGVIWTLVHLSQILNYTDTMYDFNEVSRTLLYYLFEKEVLKGGNYSGMELVHILNFS